RSLASPHRSGDPPAPPARPTRRSSDLAARHTAWSACRHVTQSLACVSDAIHDTSCSSRIILSDKSNLLFDVAQRVERPRNRPPRSEEHTSELQSRANLVCRLLLEKRHA